MSTRREYPGRPMVGVGGVVIENGSALLIRRGSPPHQGEWTIPGGLLELGETLVEGVRREIAEETSLQVEVLGLIELFERIIPDGSGRLKYHYVVADYLCRRQAGEPRAGGDAADVAWVPEDQLEKYTLTEAAMRVLRSAFAMSRP